MTANHPVYLGLDTGGTYTDAVLWADDGARGRIVASAKALTTRHDLAVGIAEAAGRVIAESGIDPGSVAMVSMSTTLATNALVEGQGGRVALVLAGFSEKDLLRDGLGAALGNDPVVWTWTVTVAWPRISWVHASARACASVSAWPEEWI